jgi:chemotaxis protein methyltransferase CheR
MLTTISDKEFGQFQRFIYEAAGITLSAAKKALVCGRLSKRLQQRQLKSYSDYFRLLSSGEDAREVQMAIDLLTTNETYFFREPKHFDVLRQQASQSRAGGRNFRIWSAASSSGEEAYSMAMVLADCLPEESWEVLASDVSLRVLEQARTGHYPDSRTTHIPRDYLRRFCLKGNGQHEGTLLVDRKLRNRVQFIQVNLNETLPRLGQFDMIFLRNVMIYFNHDTKRQVVERILGTLKPGGTFIIGHSESLHDISTAVQQVSPSVYRKPT